MILILKLSLLRSFSRLEPHGKIWGANFGTKTFNNFGSLTTIRPRKIHFSHPAVELIILSPAQTQRGHCLAAEEQQQRAIAELRCQERISVLGWKGFDVAQNGGSDSKSCTPSSQCSWIYLQNHLLKKCKSAPPLIKCTLARCCLVKLQKQKAKPGCSLLKNEELTSRFHLKPRARLPGTNKTGVKTKLFLLTFPPSHPRKSREALPSLALMFVWQQNRGFAVLSSLQTCPAYFSEDPQFFSTIMSKVIS